MAPTPAGAPPVIAAKLTNGGRLSAALVTKAGALARARASRILLARRADGSGWRSARLLWPLFDAKD
ncbi:hypothetical protein GRI38_09055 [Altererythrobacter aurantiacus]|uniref:Uncharacterized protein n=1 Tax=Parapontixanthobacter aurantiacus TaxID=1463599 RepID=A0A844ZGA1_9SPHN|nr:hypothetical protein [Parapontixanthobacter aurantiacus]